MIGDLKVTQKQTYERERSSIFLPYIVLMKYSPPDGATRFGNAFIQLGFDPVFLYLFLRGHTPKTSKYENYHTEQICSQDRLSLTEISRENKLWILYLSPQPSDPSLQLQLVYDFPIVNQLLTSTAVANFFILHGDATEGPLIFFVVLACH